MQGRELTTLSKIVEVKLRLNGESVQYECYAMKVAVGEHAVLAMRMVQAYRPPVAQAPAVPVGTWTLAHYWRDAPYNLYYWIDVAGMERGAYFNLCRPPTRIDARKVVYQDLALDLWVGPGGPRLLDVEEITRAHPIELRKEVATALATLRRDWKGRLFKARSLAASHLRRLSELD